MTVRRGSRSGVVIVGLVVIGGVLSGSGTGSGSGSQLWWGSKDSTDL